MTQTDKQTHIPGPWDPLPEGYWVELRKRRPDDPGYYYLRIPERRGFLDYIEQRSGKFTPENVAKHFRPAAKADVKRRARERRQCAVGAACEGISTEALEAGVVADLLEACEEIVAMLEDQAVRGFSINGMDAPSRARMVAAVAATVVAIAKAKGETP